MRLDITTHGRRRRATRRRVATEGAVVAAAGTTGAALGFFLARRATHQTARPQRTYDDVTLARKVESEIFRPDDAPKGSVDVDAYDGVVELRGQVKHPDEIRALENAAARVDGVQQVVNLLHTPGTPPKHAPISDPADVRRRAAVPRSPSGFARGPAAPPPTAG